MKNPNETECWICGKKYHYCPHCNRYEKWMETACCSEHYEINLILDEYRNGIVNKSQATEMFKNIGIDDNYDFSKILSAVARDIRLIISNPISAKEKKTKK